VSEANRLFGAPDMVLVAGLDILLRPPADVRARFTTRIEEILPEL